jgi:predicted dehydrogenase
MVGVGMIFEETYWPLFQQVHEQGLYTRATGALEVELSALASRIGSRAARTIDRAASLGMQAIRNCTGPDAIEQLLAGPVDAVCIATPDDRHFAAASKALAAGKHVFIEKPSVLDLAQLDELTRLAEQRGVLARVVYHKLADPDHKKLRTHVVDGVLRHVNNGYCSLLEPKSISGQQFAEWIAGRNPGTYVAVHYIKLIDFTFGQAGAGPLPWRLARVSATGQRGLVGPASGPTWDSVQLQMVYAYPDGREAAFDIHTSWVTPDNFPGYVDQEVQFRFDNGVWLAHQRKRGVEVTVEGRTPGELKYTPNHHYNGTFLEPWGERSQRGYGIEVIRRFFEEVAFVEHGGPREGRSERLKQVRQLAYADVSADRPTVATVQAMEAILRRHAAGKPGCVVKVNEPAGGLVLYAPGEAEPEVLYRGRV